MLKLGWLYIYNILHDKTNLSRTEYKLSTVHNKELLNIGCFLDNKHNIILNYSRMSSMKIQNIL